MSSLRGAIDMNNLSMPVESAQKPLSSVSYSPQQSTSGTSERMMVDQPMNGVAPFTDPAVLQQFQEMEQESKFPLPMVPNSLSSAMGNLAQSGSSGPSALNPNSAPSQISAMSMTGFELTAMYGSPSHPNIGASPPSNFTSTRASPPHATSYPTSAAPTPGGTATFSQPEGTSFSGSVPTSPGATTTTGVPLSGVIPARDGSKLTLGAVVASVLDNVVLMASQARDAYLAGKQDQTHLEIEELLESLKLVGGLGVGPTITGVHSNRANVDMEADGTAMSPLPGPSVAPLGRDQALPGRSAEPRDGFSSTRTESAHSYSSAMSNGLQQPISPSNAHMPVISSLPLQSYPHNLQDPSAPLNMVSTSPPTVLAPNLFAPSLGSFPPFDNDPGSLPMGLAPTASFDSTRKRTASSAPTRDDVFRGPNKITKLSPPGPELKELTPAKEPSPKLTHGVAAASSGRISPSRDQPALAPQPPPLAHARTFPMAGIGSMALAGGQLPPLPADTAGAQFSVSFMSMESSTHTPVTAVDSMAPMVYSNVRSAAASPDRSSLNDVHSQMASPQSTAQPLWPSDAMGSVMSGMIIPPPHTTSMERHSGVGEMPGFRPGALVPMPSSLVAPGMQPALLSDHPMSGLSGHPTQMSFESQAADAHRPPMINSMNSSSFGGRAQSSMDVDLSTPPHTHTGLMPVSPVESKPHHHTNAGFPHHPPSTQAPYEGFSSQAASQSAAVPQSRPTTASGRPSPPRTGAPSSSQNPSSVSLKSERSDSVPEESDDENDDDEGDSEDDEEDPGPGGPSSRAANPMRSGTKRSASKPPTARRKGRDKAGGYRPDLTLSPEMKVEVDRVFEEYLNEVCSNVDLTDAKGEGIHQVLMAKKMARMDESTDFRPFKFRIQAFTNGFVEELARQGYDDAAIPMKKIKTYLWYHTPYIARFNDDGKKSKSKGNHIWHTEAKKLPVSPYGNGGIWQRRWTFHEYERKIAGNPPAMAYIGLKWNWEPKVWDPQTARSNIAVQWNFPNMPDWMKYENGVLSGTPTQDSTSIDLIVESRSMLDGQEIFLQRTYSLTVAPLAVGDSFTTSRRPSLLTSDPTLPKRFASEAAAPQTVAPRIPQLPAVSLPPPVPTPAESAQVMAVLNNAAQRVAQEAVSQAIQAAPGPAQVHTQAVLAKQQQVLTITAQVIQSEAHNALVGRQVGDQPVGASVLAAAAQGLVHQAARQVQADKTAVALQHSKTHPTVPQPPSHPPSVSLTDVSIATQSAVAHAVAITGSGSSEVEVMLTANSLIQQRSRAESRTGLRPNPASLLPSQQQQQPPPPPPPTPQSGYPTMPPGPMPPNMPSNAGGAMSGPSNAFPSHNSQTNFLR
ncbi:hypothetical protein FRB94_005964 [Tulasnella sp. JGI-2019a]|nr:hypothetical protein FRB94_005964 [Tulasnella sp. JGI-2019a]